MYRVLICDDDKAIVDSIEIYLKHEGYEVIKAYDGIDAINKVKENEIHCMILDIMMPKMDGLMTAGKLRENYNFPIIMLSAKSEDTDKIIGLEFGADDYVTKPFDIEELKTRVDVHLKNSLKNKSTKPIDNEHFSFGGVVLNLETREVTVGENIVQLTRTEFAIFKLLITNKGRVVSKAQIINLTSEDTPDLVDSSLKVHVRNLRKKLKTITDHEFVEAIWGIGFRFVPIES